ncbi:hypothetical protein TNCV_3977901 [Trichonephila clavipes]|nr:hypothetical protein TNCV_3977901 [Trichonephila clavipes]
MFTDSLSLYPVLETMNIRHAEWLMKVIHVIAQILPVDGGWGTATTGSDVDQSGRPIFDDFFQNLCPFIGNNKTNVVFQMVRRLCLIRIDQ